MDTLIFSCSSHAGLDAALALLQHDYWIVAAGAAMGVDGGAVGTMMLRAYVYHQGRDLFNHRGKWGRQLFAHCAGDQLQIMCNCFAL